MEDLRETLVRLGFTKNEAAAYVALVSTHPVSGYELAKLSGVPLAKVYEVVNRLVARGAVAQVSTDPAQYAPIDPEELTRSLRSHYTGLLDTLETGLQEVSKERSLDYVWNLLSYDEIVSRTIELCEQSTTVLRILCWDQEMAHVRGAVLDAQRRGVKVIVVGHGEMGELPGCSLIMHEVLPHVIPERGRQLAVVSDDHTMLLGSFHPAPGGLWSRNPGLAFLARELIMHEAYLWRLVDRFGDAIRVEYGQDLHRLREW